MILIVFSSILQNIKGQTCSTPLILSNLNGNLTPLDSFSTKLNYFKFIANNNIISAKIYVKGSSNAGYNPVQFYLNDCSNLPSSVLSVTFTTLDDTIYVDYDQFTQGQEYLIEIQNVLFPSYQPYQLSLNNFITPSTFFCAPLNPCFTNTCELVCNGSFEHISSQVNNFSQLNLAYGWGDANGGTSDLISTNAVTGCGLTAPCSCFGNENPYVTTCTLNNNYASSIMETNPNLNTHYSEYIQNQLTSTMVAGKNYLVSFWISRGENGTGILNSLGVYFTPNAISTSSMGPLSNIPNFVCTNTTALNSFSGWKRISFCYNAQGGEKYITIGRPNGSVISQGPPPSTPCTFTNTSQWPDYSAYVFYDNVSVQLFDLDLIPTQTVNVCGSVNLNPQFVCNAVPNTTLSYAWSGTQTLSSTSIINPVATVTSSTIFNLNVTGQTNYAPYCTASAVVSINALTLTPLTITPSSSTVCPNSNVTLNVTGGTGTYTFLPGSFIGNNVVFTPTATTTYTAIGTTTNGCTISKTITIYTFTNTISATALPPNICVGFNSTLTGVNGTSNYTWQPGNLTGTNVVVSPISTTIYTVSGLSVNGCLTKNTIQVTVNNLPTINISPAVNNTICINSSINLIPTGATSYTWLPMNIPTTNIIVSPTSATTYTINGTNAFGCIGTTTAYVYVNPQPTLSCNLTTPFICPNLNTTLSANGAVTYTWFPGNIVGQNAIVNPSVTTNYTVIGTSALGCTNNCILTQSVYPLTSNFFSIVATPTSICVQSPSITTAVLNIVGTPNYTWVPSNIVNNTITATSSGIYSASSTYTNGCIYTNTLLLNQTDQYASINSTIICSNSPTLNLYNLTNPTSGCSFSVNGIPSSNIFGPNPIPGVYTIQVLCTASVLCSNYAINTITVLPAPVMPTVTPSYSVACTGSPYSLTATPLISQTYTWLPFNYVGNPLVITPTSVVTVTLITGPPQCTLSYSPFDLAFVDIPCVCLNACSNTIGIATNTTIIGQSFCVPNNLLISGAVTFSNCEFKIAPNSSITIGAGNSLSLTGCHLYACENMWQGIYVLDGGKLVIKPSGSKDNLIEDAITAIDISNHTTSTLTAFGAILDVSYTTFNKNFISININNYSRNITPYPFAIHNSVFTSRSLTFTPTSWPTCSTTAGSMRALNNPTAGLQVPYLLNGSTFIPSNLKAPNNTQPSHIAIKLNGVGSSTGTVQYAIQIGRTSNANDYNIFDNLGQGIEATNSNVFSVNNVFQNTQQYTFDPPGPNPPYTFGGNGIRHFTNINNFNSKLDLWSTSTNMSLGNRFYDCHYAVNCDKTFLLNIRYCTFRSTKTTSATATGSIAVISRTNRFHHTISNNNIANIHTPINIALAPDTYTYNGNSGYGINAQNLAIQNNYIGSQTTTAASLGSCFVNQAITLSAPTGSVYQVTLNSFAVTTNTIDRVYRGIEINNFGKTNFTANTSTNTIKLGDDNVFTLPQYAIKYTDNYIGVLRSNTLSATGITNTLITLFYAGNSVSNPTVICNSLSNAYTGFEFNSNNSNVFWRGNLMSPMARGLYLNQNGIIGTQGSNGNPADNEWKNTWVTGTHYGTYTGTLSAAQNSLIWYRSIGGTFVPPNNSGTVSPTAWYGGLNTLSTTSTGSFTGCGTNGGGGGGGASATTMLSLSSSQNNNLNTDMVYIQDFGNYQTSLSTSSSSNFNNQTTSNSTSNNSIDKFLKVDGLYYSGNITSAKALNASITCTNSVESIYKTYYNLYDKFISNNFNDNDNNSLSYIAELCPGTNGTAVYKARALFNYINKVARIYVNNCVQNNLSKQTASIDKILESAYEFNIELFPNPAENFVNLFSANYSEELFVKVCDVNGKLLVSENTKLVNHETKLNLDLKSGIYFVTITNNKNETKIKKLIITK